MGKLTKWIAGGLGWAFLGPIGGIIGFALGALLEKVDMEMLESPHGRTTTPGDFAMSLIVLAAAVMKADGKILKSELNYVKQFFKNNFGLETAKEILLVLRDILKQPISVGPVCQQIRKNLDYSSRLQLLHFLYRIALADGRLHTEETKLIQEIVARLGISGTDHESIRSMFVNVKNAPYKILEIPADASNEEVKRAYRRMALKYHPDKVEHLGEDFQGTAKEKFQKVNQAYETIKKQRNFS